MKLQYYYIGKSTFFNDIPTRPFKAVTMKLDGVKTLVPIILNRWEKDKEITPKTKIFVHGFGRKNIGKGKIIEVPLFDNEAEHWDGYIEKYGKLCLYYSLTGCEYYSFDCCLNNIRAEFNSINNYGAVAYADFISNFLRINELQLEVLKKYHEERISKCQKFDMWCRDYLFYPCYSIYGIPFPYSPDVIEDDKRMEKFYMLRRREELTEKHPRYSEYIVLSDKAAAFRNQCDTTKYGWSWHQKNNEGKTYEDMCDDASDVYDIIKKAVNEQIMKEVNEDNDVFPTSMSDRIKYLYGEETESVYSYLCDTYLANNDNYQEKSA